MFSLPKFCINQKGQALVEAALLIPILFFLLFGIITVAWWLNVNQVATNAAREGARIGALTNDNGQIEGAVYSVMEVIEPDTDKINVGVDPLDEADADRTRGNPLTVQVSYDLPFQFPFLPDAFNTVVAQSVARIEYVP